MVVDPIGDRQKQIVVRRILSLEFAGMVRHMIVSTTEADPPPAHFDELPISDSVAGGRWPNCSDSRDGIARCQTQDACCSRACGNSYQSAAPGQIRDIRRVSHDPSS
jgi:hypothetical protein